MFETLDLIRMAGAMAAHSGARLGVIAGNIANADTPGYKARDLPSFEEVWRDSAGDGMRATRPGHLGSTAPDDPATPFLRAGAGSPDGNTVSLQAEMVAAAEVRQDHDIALAIYRNAGDILRAALGRR